MREYKSALAVLYCVNKRGQLEVSDETRAMYIAESQSFEELKILLTIFETADNGWINEETLSLASSYLQINFPTLDRLLRWPWDEGYEP